MIFSCEKLYQECMEMFYEGGSGFKGELSTYKLTFEVDCIKYNVFLEQSDIKLVKPQELENESMNIED